MLPHLIHVSIFTLLILLFVLLNGGIVIEGLLPQVHFTQVGYYTSFIINSLRLFVILLLPISTLHFLSLILFNVFPRRPTLRGSLSLAPFVSFRVVTRGDFPDLVARNVERNLQLCWAEGLRNFIVEVVTDKSIGLKRQQCVREVVVPREYQTKTGALYKARALQYCWENHVNILNDTEWLVHLDEETVLTGDSIRGIINFILDGSCPIGQGAITYANDQVINWFTTMADCCRVGTDFGLCRAQFMFFSRALFMFKGSFVLCQASVERAVSFDHGFAGSITEDAYFAAKAVSLGYKFGWVEGEMWEKSPFTIADYIKQRKRWLQGLLLVVHDKQLPFRAKACLAISTYACASMPLFTSLTILNTFFTVPQSQVMSCVLGFVGAVNLYLFLIGAVKSFSFRRLGLLRYFLCLVGVVVCIPLTIACENAATLCALFSRKGQFYVVDKAISASHPA